MFKSNYIEHLATFQKLADNASFKEMISCKVPNDAKEHESDDFLARFADNIAELERRAQRRSPNGAEKLASC